MTKDVNKLTAVAKNAHKVVKAWRNKSKDWYPLPNNVDVALFAVTEAAEAIDAYLRKNASYKRSNVKNNNVQLELGDLLFMLLSFDGYVPFSSTNGGMVPSEIHIATFEALSTRRKLSTISLSVTWIAQAFVMAGDSQLPNESVMQLVSTMIDSTILAILSCGNFDISYLYGTLKKIEMKHKPQTSGDKLQLKLSYTTGETI